MTMSTGLCRPCFPLAAELLSAMIARAAVLSDTPGKWAETLLVFKRLGVDPAGYEDFDNGRKAVIESASL